VGFSSRSKAPSSPAGEMLLLHGPSPPRPTCRRTTPACRFTISSRCGLDTSKGVHDQPSPVSLVAHVGLHHASVCGPTKGITLLHIARDRDPVHASKANANRRARLPLARHKDSFPDQRTFPSSSNRKRGNLLPRYRARSESGNRPLWGRGEVHVARLVIPRHNP